LLGAVTLLALFCFACCPDCWSPTDVLTPGFMPYSDNKISNVCKSCPFIYYLLSIFSLFEAGFSLLVFCAFLARRLPSLLFVLLSVRRFLILTGALHWLAVLTTRPFRLPLVHLTARLTVLPVRFQTILASVMVSSENSDNLTLPNHFNYKRSHGCNQCSNSCSHDCNHPTLNFI